MKAMLFVLLSAFFCILLAQQMIWVNGYYRSDGTYVEGHYRTTPDNSTYNNYGGEYNKPSRSTTTYDDYNSSNTNSSSDQVWVNGYYRSDGTWVQGHYRRR